MSGDYFNPESAFGNKQITFLRCTNSIKNTDRQEIRLRWYKFRHLYTKHGDFKVLSLEIFISYIDIF